MAERFFGSPFDPVVFQRYPDILSAGQLVEDFKVQLGDFKIEAQVFQAVESNLAGLDLSALQGYWG